ncbi:hypothetical protein Moror_11055 [Moniliophthora roreri MCA 2997]|uniref:Uncharacterized protein n=2 Tax=Moniliophthora roreri TaxID=221103 RepID=V2WVW6_MONRO|nr:hypothetical protein Moror_11055 [Moniliophthora roreri MCA 2997]
MHGRHGLTVKAVETQIARAYDAWHGLNESDAVGGEKKILDLVQRYMRTQAKLARGPLRSLIYELESVFRVRYLINKPPQDSEDEVSDGEPSEKTLAQLKKLDDTEWICQRFSEALREKDQLIQQERDPERDPKLPNLRGEKSAANARKRKKTTSELQEEALGEEEEKEEEERPLRKPRTPKS